MHAINTMQRTASQAAISPLLPLPAPRPIASPERLVSPDMHAVVPGCFNIRYLRAVLQQGRDSNITYALLLLDLDKFKRVVDAEGHVVAAEVIESVGKRLADAVKSVGHVVHWGGDEFVVLLPNTGLDQAQNMAAQLRHVTASETGLSKLSLSASVGISFGRADTTLLARAEQALRLAKASHEGMAVAPLTTASSNLLSNLPLAPQTVLAPDAHRDPLTHLFTRAQLWHDLHATLHEARHSVAVAMWDLDGFREINTQHGFATGSHVLQAVAHALAAFVGPRSPTYRFGGDEFCTIYTGQAAKDAAHICRSAQHAIKRQQSWGGVACQLSLRVGLAYRTEDTATPKALLREADRRLMEAKHRGFLGSSEAPENHESGQAQ